jgi:alpha-glucosidase (family GH31 glycosyl hydrolase)
MLFKHLISLIFLALPSLFVNASNNPQGNKNTPSSQPADSNVVLPPAWAFGVLYGGYTNQQQTISRINEIISHDYPIDAYWIDSWFWSFGNKGSGPAKYIDFVADTVEFPNRKAMWDFMQKRNIKGGFWIWDCIFETGNETAFRDFDEKGFFRNKYVEHNPWHNYSTTTAMHQAEGKNKGTLCGNIDFNNPQAVAYFKQKMKTFFDEGADFLKLDRTSAIEVCKAMFEISQEMGNETEGRGFILSHTGGQEREEYKRYPAKWTDDTRTDWDVVNPTKEFNSWVPPVALKENISMFTDPQKPSSSIPFLTNDLGGFDMGKTDKLDEELYIRWLQFSIFTPIVEVFSQPENPTSNMAYLLSERADSLFRKYTHLRMELFPYIYSCAHRVRLNGQQMMQALPENTFDYLFGHAFLVAPVYKQSANSRTVNLPTGNWINYWTDQTIHGGSKIDVSASIGEIPLFVRQGSIIPMRRYASSIEKGTNDTLIVHIYPGADGEFTLFEDDGRSNAYLHGEIAKTKMQLINGKVNNETFIIFPITGSYKGMSNIRTIQLKIHSTKKIKNIKLNGKAILLNRCESKTESVYLQWPKNKKATFTLTFLK